MEPYFSYPRLITHEELFPSDPEKIDTKDFYDLESLERLIKDPVPGEFFFNQKDFKLYVCVGDRKWVARG